MLSFHWREVKLLRDDCVSWEELSCSADGEGAEERVAALLELRSVSSNHSWVPGLLEACTGLWRLLELWLDMPLGLGGLLGVSEVSPAADPIGEENWSSLRLVVRKLVLRRKKEIHYASRHWVPPQPPTASLYKFHFHFGTSIPCLYVQISVWPNNGIWAAIVKERWLTTRDHGQKLPVDLLLLFTNRLDNFRRKMESKNGFRTNHIFSHCHGILPPVQCCVEWPCWCGQTRCCALGSAPLWLEKSSHTCWCRSCLSHH